MNKTHELLDLAIPLAGASHANVVSYDVAVPLRYSECIATLDDGRQVRLRHPGQLVGWSGPAGQRSLIFKHGDRGIEIRMGGTHVHRIRSIHACRLMVAESPFRVARCQHKLVARDGSLVYTNQMGRTPLPIEAATPAPRDRHRPIMGEELMSGVPA